MYKYVNSSISWHSFRSSWCHHFFFFPLRLFLVQSVPIVLREMDARKVLPDRTTYVLSIRILLACKGFSCSKTQCLSREHADFYDSITRPYHQPRAARGRFFKVLKSKTEKEGKRQMAIEKLCSLLLFVSTGYFGYDNRFGALSE